MKKVVARAAVFTIALALALGAGELIARQLPEFAHAMYYEDAARTAVPAAEAGARGLVLGGALPRGRLLWAPSTTFWICYTGGSRPYMDDRGCTRVDINAFSLRDRADLTEAKPAGEKRVLCLGDSFTFGWGVPIEMTWPRLVEPLLAGHGGGHAEGDGAVRTVNCGASGTLLVDEYWWGLRDRFGKFDPDVVLVSICLNDLVAMPNVVGLFTEQTIHGCAAHGWLPRWDCADCVAAARTRFDQGLLDRSRLWSLLTQRGDLHARLALDPSVDWGQWLIDLPEDWPAPLAPQHSHYEAQGTPAEATWHRGGPQHALRAMRDWCRERKVAFGVVVWPLFQGLEGGAHYPFATLHRVVAEFCAAEQIACLDLLPAFRGRDSMALWVDPSDPHGNEIAHEVAAAPIATFVDGIWPEDR